VVAIVELAGFTAISLGLFVVTMELEILVELKEY
jgi:hypothetical protein